MSPCRTELRIRIHRIMTNVDEIHQFNDDTYMTCVCFMSHHQIAKLSLFAGFSVTVIKFYAGGHYKLLNQCKSHYKLIFHVVIPREYQYGRKIMKINDFFMYLSTHNHNTRICGLPELNSRSFPSK